MSRRYQARTFDVTSPHVTQDPHLHNANRRSNRALTTTVRAQLTGTDAHLPRKTKKAARSLFAPSLAYWLGLKAMEARDTQRMRQETRDAVSAQTRGIAPQYAANARERGDLDTAALWDQVAAGTIPGNDPTIAATQARERAARWEAVEQDAAQLEAEANKEDYQ